MKKRALHILDLFRQEESDVEVTFCGTWPSMSNELRQEMLSEQEPADKA